MMPHIVSAIAGFMARRAARTELERSRLEDITVLGLAGGVSVLAAIARPVYRSQDDQG